MSETSRRGFFRILAAGVAAVVASRAVNALAIPVVPLPRGARMHAALQELLKQDVYVSWFHALRVGNFDGHTLKTFVPGKFFKNWIDNNYSAELLTAARSEFSGVQRVDLIALSPNPTKLCGSFKHWNARLGFGHFFGDDGTRGWIRLKKWPETAFNPSAKLHTLIRPGEPVTLMGNYAIDRNRTRWELNAVLASGEIVPLDTHIVFG